MKQPAPQEGKWWARLHGEMPCVVAARRVLKRRLRTVGRLLPLAAQRADENVEYVHQLRVATRRSAAALRLFDEFIPPKPARKLRALLRAIRRAAGAARQADVHILQFRRDVECCPEERRLGYEALLAHLAEDRRAAQRSILAVARRATRRKLRKQTRRVLEALQLGGKPRAGAATGGSPAYTLRELAHHRLPDAIERVRAGFEQPPGDIAALHRLRIDGKRLRYLFEICGGCFADGAWDEMYPRIQDLQDRLGDAHDAYEMADRVERLCAQYVRGDPHNGISDPRALASLVHLRDLLRERYRAAHDAFREWCASGQPTALLDELCRLLDRGSARAPGPADCPAADPACAAPPADAPARRSVATVVRPQRIAAIDVGTNSIRMVVAETDPITGYRVIEEMKETTRLGAELATSGRMSAESVERSLAALERMRAVADGYRVLHLRAVGTAAAREASNRDWLLEEARARAGIDIEIIDAESEARLAFASVAEAFNLDDCRAAVIDLGGGSTEIILSAAGMLDGIWTLPVGGVRLTELFGSGGRYRFREMCSYVDDVIRHRVPKPDPPPDLVIGTGGTFTSLARVSIRRGLGGDGAGRFPFAVRGHELRHREVAYILAWLRRMAPEKRRTVPGLSVQRSEIIVAGLCIVERLMSHLGVGRLRVHDGGIRDGLLSRMIDELGLQPPAPQGGACLAIDDTRRFAERCRYERAHSEHVTYLALQLFDQLCAHPASGPGAWRRRENRVLLQAAAILHDVGTLVSYARHHKHSYNMIMHAEIPSFSRREIEIVANLARYHRKAGPSNRHRAFLRLSDEDQRVVTHLAGILRVADGLDRLHTQNVTDVVVEPCASGFFFRVQADDDATVNLRFAKRKADVFEAAFHASASFGLGTSRVPTLSSRPPAQAASAAVSAAFDGAASREAASPPRKARTHA